MQTNLNDRVLKELKKIVQSNLNDRVLKNLKKINDRINKSKRIKKKSFRFGFKSKRSCNQI